MTTRLFSELNISPDVLKAIEKLGFEKASPIQAETIPTLLEGHDVVGQSQTGSGKTAAFAIPAIERIDPDQRGVQVLILCPTRELAVQVSEEVHKLALFKRGIRALPVYGGQSYDRQLYGLKQGAQIIIGTPGRVMDHMRRGTLKLDGLKMAILDEADVMLDMGFRDDIEIILQGTPATRQTVFFSATMPRAIQELIKKYARDPRSIRIEQKSMTVPTVEQAYYEVDRRFKVELLTRLIDIHDLKLGIVFCNTKRMVDDLVDHLNAQGYSADRLHGDMTQMMRDRVMNKFRRSGLEFLVATDVAARGIDVDDVQVVFNYDLPYDVEDYVHRIGRTGRAGRSGRAISFVAGRELFQIQQIERYTKTRIQRAKVPTVIEVEEARANAFLGKLRATLQAGEYQKQDHLIEVLLEEGFTSTDIASALIHHLQHEQPRPAGEREEEQDFRQQGRGRSGPPGFADREQPDRFGNDRGRPQRREQQFGGNPSPRVAPPRARVAPPRPDRPRPAAAPAERAAAAPAERAAAAPAERAAAAPAERAPVAPQNSRPDSAPIPTPAPQQAPAEAPSQPLPPAAAAAPIKPPQRTELRPPVKAKAPWMKPKGAFGQSDDQPKASRRTPSNQTRIHLNIGSQMGLDSDGIVRLIQGETGLPASGIGYVDPRERHAFVDIDSTQAKAVVAKLNRSQLNGRRLKAKMREHSDSDSDSE